jgi:hypothetical protein
MPRLLGFLSVILAVTTSFSVSAHVLRYSVTFVPCAQGSTCPHGNPITLSRTFALNGTLNPNLTLNAGDRLEFDLATAVPNYPLVICQKSTLPDFCHGVANSNLLNTPITQAGTNTSATFTTAGTYYYGCHTQPGMGGIINVVQITTTATTTTAKPITTTRAPPVIDLSGVGHKLSASFLLSAIFTLLAVIIM